MTIGMRNSSTQRNRKQFMLSTPEIIIRPIKLCQFAMKIMSAIPEPTTQAHCRLVGYNNCKCSWNQHLNAPKYDETRNNLLFFTHSMATLLASIIIIIIIISLLMSSLLGHRPFLWITPKENGSYPTTRA
jgi:hypothetical protein